MRLIDADAMRQDWLENGENEYVYDTNAVLDSIDAQPTIDAVPRPSYRVPTKEEWRERYCTNKQLAGIRHRKRKDGDG